MNFGMVWGNLIVLLALAGMVAGIFGWNPSMETTSIIALLALSTAGSAFAIASTPRRR